MKRILTILTLLISIVTFGQNEPLYFNFDTTESVYIDTTLANNLWQIGKPQKTYFNSSYSFPNAIMTDTINSYSINNISEFTIKTPTYMGGWGGIVMDFKHKYDTDSLIDGGTILVSEDGSTWTNLITSAGLFPFWTGFDFYPSTDTITSLNDLGFSGRSDGWQHASCFWNYPPADTLWLKFRFTSDGIQTNKEGWMVDTITFQYNLGIGIKELSTKTSYRIAPNPFKYYTIITLDNVVTNATFNLYNSKGQRIRQLNNISGKQINVERGTLATGIYSFIIQIKDSKALTGRLCID